MDNEQQLKAGDRVSFCVVGNPADPFGFGVVTFASKSKTLIQPDAQMSVGLMMEKIKKVGS